MQLVILQWEAILRLWSLRMGGVVHLGRRRREWYADAANYCLRYSSCFALNFAWSCDRLSIWLPFNGVINSLSEGLSTNIFLLMYCFCSNNNNNAYTMLTQLYFTYILYVIKNEMTSLLWSMKHKTTKVNLFHCIVFSVDKKILWIFESIAQIPIFFRLLDFIS